MHVDIHIVHAFVCGLCTYVRIYTPIILGVELGPTTWRFLLVSWNADVGFQGFWTLCVRSHVTRKYSQVKGVRLHVHLTYTPIIRLPESLSYNADSFCIIVLEPALGTAPGPAVDQLLNLPDNIRAFGSWLV